jgi:hypothetical protein
VDLPDDRVVAVDLDRDTPPGGEPDRFRFGYTARTGGFRVLNVAAVPLAHGLADRWQLLACGTAAGGALMRGACLQIWV